MPSLFRRINTLADHIWPATQATATRWQLFAMTLAAGLALGWLMRSAPLLGHDWLIMFHANTATDVYYPPWTSLLLTPLANLPWRDGLALINGISIATVATSTYHQGKQTNNPWRLGATLLAVFSLQLAIVLWLGHIDGLALLGLLALPWAAPLVLMKATFIGFAVFARKSWFLAAVLFGLASLLLWPGWPNQLLQTLSLRNTHPSAAGWEVTGWLPPVIGLVMLLLSKRTDPFQAMAAGSLLYPFALPYHWLVLLPAIGSLRGLYLLMAWLAATLMIVPVGINRHFWIYYIFPVFIWLIRYHQEGSTQSWLALITTPYERNAS